VYKILEHSRGIDGLTWSHSQSLLVTGEEKSEMDDGTIRGWIRVFDMPSGTEIKTLDFGNTVNELFFSQDDQYLLAVGHGAVKIYNAVHWGLVQTLKPDYYVIFTSGVFSPDGRHVIYLGGGLDKTIQGARTGTCNPREERAAVQKSIEI